jgi:hypothetical protein
MTSGTLTINPGSPSFTDANGVIVTRVDPLESIPCRAGGYYKISFPTGVVTFTAALLGATGGDGPSGNPGGPSRITLDPLQLASSGLIVWVGESGGDDNSGGIFSGKGGPGSSYGGDGIPYVGYFDSGDSGPPYYAPRRNGAGGGGATAIAVGIDITTFSLIAVVGGSGGGGRLGDPQGDGSRSTLNTDHSHDADYSNYGLGMQEGQSRQFLGDGGGGAGWTAGRAGVAAGYEYSGQVIYPTQEADPQYNGIAYEGYVVGYGRGGEGGTSHIVLPATGQFEALGYQYQVDGSVTISYMIGSSPTDVPDGSGSFSTASFNRPYTSGLLSIVGLIGGNFGPVADNGFYSKGTLSLIGQQTGNFNAVSYFYPMASGALSIYSGSAGNFGAVSSNGSYAVGIINIDGRRVGSFAAVSFFSPFVAAMLDLSGRVVGTFGIASFFSPYASGGLGISGQIKGGFSPPGCNAFYASGSLGLVGVLLAQNMPRAPDGTVRTLRNIHGVPVNLNYWRMK